MAYSVLIVGTELGRAAQVQRELTDHGIVTYFTMGLERAHDAIAELEPDAVVVEDHAPVVALDFLEAVAQARPRTARILVASVPPALFARERRRGIVTYVVYPRALVETVVRLGRGLLEAHGSTSYSVAGDPERP